MTLIFRSLGKKFHHSIWCFLTLYVLVLFSLTFVLSGGLELVSSSSFFPWFSLQESYHHITCHSLRCCPVSNSVSLVSPHKVSRLGSPILLWHRIALTSHSIQSLLSKKIYHKQWSFLVWYSIGSIGNCNLKHDISDMILVWSHVRIFFQLTQ